MKILEIIIIIIIINNDNQLPVNPSTHACNNIFEVLKIKNQGI